MPRYLNDRISSLPNITDNKSRRRQQRLDKLHVALAISYDSKLLLNRHVWVSGLDGHTCDYQNTNSIAQNLDMFQQELPNSRDRKLTICAINVTADDEFEVFLPSYQRNPTRFKDLLDVILSDHWSDSCQRISDCMREVKHRPLSQRTWQPQLPSRTSVTQLPLTEPSLCNLDLMLEWVHARPKFEQDWSLYVSEIHAQRPRVEALRFVALTAQGSADCRLMLIATSGEALERCKQEQDNAVKAKYIDATMRTEDQVLGSILASLDFIIAEVLRQITDTINVTRKLVSLL